MVVGHLMWPTTKIFKLKKMNKNLYTILFSIGFCFLQTAVVFAGNPDRQGESGAGELLLNPWGRSAGFHSMNTSSVFGVESMRINIAGLSRISSGELTLASSRLYEGTGLTTSAIGFATKSGENGAIGISLTSLSFGNIPITTTAQPEGLGGTFSPNFFNIAVGYSYMYANKISVGMLLRGISESLPDVSAFGFGIDAGVQYVSGENDNFKLGISLRNVGSPMTFGGEGLSFSAPNTGGQVSGTTYNLTYDRRAASFELPSVLDIGLSYDFYLNRTDYIRGIANFTSNAFSADNLGVGAEFSFRNIFALRAAYRLEIGEGTNTIGDNLYSGLAAGVSVDVPFKKGGDTRLGLDYGFRATNVFKGTHNLGLRLSF